MVLKFSEKNLENGERKIRLLKSIPPPPWVYVCWILYISTHGAQCLPSYPRGLPEHFLTSKPLNTPGLLPRKLARLFLHTGQATIRDEVVLKLRSEFI